MNTGWIGGPVGVGERIDIPLTRAIINSILDGSLLHDEYDTLPFFHLKIPLHVKCCDNRILNPRNLWNDPLAWDKAARELASKFIKNFSNFIDNEHARMIAETAGPELEQYSHH